MKFKHTFPSLPALQPGGRLPASLELTAPPKPPAVKPGAAPTPAFAIILDDAMDKEFTEAAQWIDQRPKRQAQPHC